MNTIKNPFPIGFIYVQLPKEKSPTEIWPWMTWKDVTSDFAGLFFRAEGEAAPFGQIQQDNAPRLSQLETDQNSFKHIDMPTSNWSSYTYTGNSGGGGTEYRMRFNMRGGEVLPRNMAIRVWKRTG